MRKKPALSTLTPDEYKARLRKIIFAALGKCWMFWPPRAEVKRRCSIPSKPGYFLCEGCGRQTEKIEVDHIVPCIKPSDGFISWDSYINSRFTFSSKDLQGLCRECHKAKSKKENLERRKQKHEND